MYNYTLNQSPCVFACAYALLTTLSDEFNVTEIHGL